MKSLPDGTGAIAVVIFAKRTLPHVPIGSLTCYAKIPEVQWRTHLKYISFPGFVIANTLKNERDPGPNSIHPLITPNEQLPLLAPPKPS